MTWSVRICLGHKMPDTTFSLKEWALVRLRKMPNMMEHARRRAWKKSTTRGNDSKFWPELEHSFGSGPRLCGCKR